MSSQYTLLAPKWIIPIEPANTILVDYAVVMDNETIAAVLPLAEATTTYPDHDLQPLPQHVLLPGFVNAHAHSPMVLLRGIADDLPLMTWLQDHIWPAEKALMNEDFMRTGTELAIAEMLLSGTTCFSEHYFFENITAQTALDCGIRCNVGLSVIDAHTPWAQHVDQYLELGRSCLEHYAKPEHELLSFSWAPHAPYTLQDTHFKQLAEHALDTQLPIHIHLHETAHEIQMSHDQYGCRPLQRLKDLGLLEHKLQAVHMTQIEDEDIGLLKDHDIHIITCPESNLKLASGFCPVHKLIEADINVAIGTDGAASNNDLDMLGESKTTALLAKGIANDPTAVSAHTALRMATLNGAMALGLENKIGSIVPGKLADLIAIKLDDCHNAPGHHPHSELVYTSNRHQVTDVWIAGKRLVKERALQTLNPVDLATKAADWANRTLQYAQSHIG